MPKKRNTRNAHGSGTIRQRKDTLWEARYTVGVNPKTGKQLQKSVYAKSEKEIRKKLTAILSSLDEGTYLEPEKLTVSAWCDLWLKDYVGAVKKTTLEQYRYQIETYIKPSIGAVKLPALTSPIIQTMYNNAQKPRTEKRKQRNGTIKSVKVPGLSPKSVKNLHGVCHRLMDQAVLLRYIKSNPCDPCKLPRIEKKEIHPISGEYLPLFLEAIKDDYYGDLFYVDMFTGLREAEIIGLQWNYVNFNKGTITVKQQFKRERKVGGGGEFEFVSPKNDKERTIKVAPSVMAVLQKIKSRQAGYKMSSGGQWQNEKNLVFVNEKGGHLVDSTVYRHLKEIVADIGIPETRFHDLRHTYATLAIQSGDDIKTVSENLGHATVAFTLDIYGHVTEQMKESSADRMEKMIKSL
ncbi:MAG: site-specific integrase [Clostridia bacterium]|nr:site-specific integrase [Clostridia bacterium]